MLQCCVQIHWKRPKTETQFKVNGLNGFIPLTASRRDGSLKTKKHAGPKKAEGRVYKGGHYNYLVL